MNILTTPVTIPNIQRMRVDAVQFDGANAVATVTVVVFGTGGVVYGTYPLQIRDGASNALRATVSPLGYSDRVEAFTTSTPTGLTDLIAAYAGATLAIRNRGVETMMTAAGLMPPGAVS